MKQEPWPARAENPGPSGPGEVKSRWLNGSHQLDNAGSSIGEDGERRFEAGDPAVNHLRARFAGEDIADVMAAETVVAFTEEPRTCNSRGGRHVELGIALGAGKRVIVIGPRENVFCWLPGIEHYRAWADFEASLLACPFEVVLGRDDFLPCTGARGHEGEHQYLVQRSGLKETPE